MTDAPFSLTGKQAVVTGGLGLIGSAVSSSLARHGARVLVLDLSDDGPDQIKKRFSSDGLNVEYQQMDVTDTNNIGLRLDDLEITFGSLDIWVNAAYPRTDDWADNVQPPKTNTWRQNIDLHLSSYCMWSEFVADRMARENGGSIVNLASIYGMVAPDPALYTGLDMSTPSAYSAIKGGIVAHTKHLAARYGRQGVRVNAVSPGGVSNQQPKIFSDRYNAKTMLGRMADAEEIAWPIVFLCSGAANYITGINLVVDGGLTAL